MATTHMFQKKPDYYTSKEDCVLSLKHKVNTNPRYTNFKQTHFTAGDEEQFETYRDPSNGQLCIPIIPISTNRFQKIPLPIPDWKKYKNIDVLAVTNTFRYIFNKFKKGIFVKIKNNKLDVFLPFSKKNFINEWSTQIKIDPRYGSLINFIKHIYSMEGRRFNPKNVNKFVNTWYSNNCLVRYEFPVHEGDTNHPNMSDMLKTLCDSRTIPDMEFFINRRDFPILKKDNTEPYDHMFGKNTPLLSHSYEKYAPILSMVTRDNYADIPMPTGEDWARVSSSEGKFFPKSCREYNDEFKSIPWDDKKPTAVFRGGSTGCGVTIDTNPRLKLAYLSSITPKEDNIPLLDAGITNWNLRPRKLHNKQYLTTIDITKLPFGLSNKLTPQQQTEYKYIIHVDGHVSAFRLSLEMGMGSCLLIVDSKYRMWFRDMLIPWVHYVPIESDLSDLVEKIRWCRRHDVECKRMAEQAKVFHDRYLSKDGVLDYMQKLLITIKKQNGIYLYNEITPFQNQIQLELKQLTHSHPHGDINNINTIPNQQRSHSTLQGINWIINMLIQKDQFFSKAQEKQKLFHGKLSKCKQYNIANFPVAVKTTTDRNKENEFIHEAFVGTKCINELMKYCYNYMYTFGLFKNSLLCEVVNGITFSQYIDSDDFTLKNYLSILTQLALALHIGQKECGLVHNDLAPWNIIIQKLSKPIDLNYVIDYKTVYTIRTKLIPVIIDYGKSHVIYKNKHYGLVNMYKTSTIQDILSILITSVYQITNHRINKQDVKHLLTLSNFISGTQYRKNKFTTIRDIRNFMYSAKKFTTLTHSNKYQLSNLTPLDFITYIKHHFPFVRITESDRLLHTIDIGNARQVFQYILSSTIEEKVQSFVNIFRRARKCNIPNTNNIVFSYYILQTLSTKISSVHNIMLRFLQENGIDPLPYTKEYTMTITHIDNMYKNVNNTPIKHVNITDTFADMMTYYDENTFLNPQHVLFLTQTIPESVDMSSYKTMVEMVVLHNKEFRVPDRIKYSIVDEYINLLKIKDVIMKNNSATLPTLLETAKNIYSLNRSVFLEKIRNERGDCSVVEEYINVYNEILS